LEVSLLTALWAGKVAKCWAAFSGHRLKVAEWSDKLKSNQSKNTYPLENACASRVTLLSILFSLKGIVGHLDLFGHRAGGKSHITDANSGWILPFCGQIAT
jgi:hypothetical protein